MAQSKITMRNLATGMFAMGFTHWIYKLDGNLLDVTAPGYFDDAADMLKPGDLITVTTPDRAAILFVRPLVNGHIITRVMSLS